MAYPSAPLRSGQRMHDMMPVAEHDEMSRQLFLQSFLQDIGVHREPGNQTVWTKSVQPKFRKEHGREPKNSAEMRKAMLQDPYVQVWSSLKRIAKEMQYESAGPMVERQLPDLIAKARKYRDSNRKLGSLMLDPSVQAPRYNSEIEIHAKSGGYHTDLTEDDVFAGAEFDRTLYMLQWGGYGEWCDNMGESLAGWAKANLPDLKPKKILDMGCTIGSSTLPWVDAYPTLTCMPSTWRRPACAMAMPAPRRWARRCISASRMPRRRASRTAPSTSSSRICCSTKPRARAWKTSSAKAIAC